MTTLTHAEIHNDHRNWQSETANWRDDIQEWQRAHELALNELQDAVKQHASALKEHVKSIGRHQSVVTAHERFIAECEKSAKPKIGNEESAFEETHRKEAAKQAGLRDAHERIKKHHHTVMTKLAIATASLKSCL